MNPSYHSSAFAPSSNNVCKKRDNHPDSSSAYPEGNNENFSVSSSLGDDDMMMDDTASDKHLSKRCKVDDPSAASHALPGLQLRVCEASDFNNRQGIINGSGSFSARKLKKSHPLNIIIPPPPSAQNLGTSSRGPEGEEGPVTPLMQMIHTPTQAPGAPGPGDPAEQQRLERCWAAAASNGRMDQVSPVFAPIGPGPGALEMYRLTAEATTPTFPPESFSLSFGNGH